eukprot:TRINITY_DN5347_c0_g1_i1.p1 TRINITY_DN5347_c0_g1~~TRINITY_DN5347_c0_g1_i1.p1  ORF type:complete len:357 (-),score=137.97 TRINITY_DN5347_c0_g1_i1:72-1142(-)
MASSNITQQRIRLIENEVLIKVQALCLSEIDATLFGHFHQHQIFTKNLIFSNSLQTWGFEISATVEQIGPEVLNFTIGDHVVCFRPLDCTAGTSEHLIQRDCCLVRVPQIQCKPLGHQEAVIALRPGLRSYIALQYLHRITAGDTILILDAASPNGFIAAQLATIWGAKVIAAVNNESEAEIFKNLIKKSIKIIDLSCEKLIDIVLEETNQIGVDCILEPEASWWLINQKNNQKIFNDEFAFDLQQQILRCLAINSTWITTRPNLQIDPPESQILFSKSASISFLFEQSWLLAGSQQGRVLHMIDDLLTKIVKQELIIPPLAAQFLTTQLDIAFNFLINDPSSKYGRVIVSHAPLQ